MTAPEDADAANEQLIIHVFERKSSYGFYQCVGSGSYDYNGVTYVYNANGGDYCHGLIETYGPVGGAYKSVAGISVTVTDSGVNFVIAPPAGVQADAGKAQMNIQQDGEPVEVGRWLARFSWDAPGGSQTVTGYDFQWRREGGSWPVGVTSLSASATSLIIRPSVGDNAAETEGAVLHYRVRTRTANGVSIWIEGQFALENPANLVPYLTVDPAGAGELQLFWAASSWPVTGYDVEYKVSGAPDFQSSDPENGWVDAGHTGTDDSLIIPNLKDGTTYAVRVRVTSDWDFSWTVNEGTTSGTAPAIGGSQGIGGSEGSSGSAREDGALPPPSDGNGEPQPGDEPPEEPQPPTPPEETPQQQQDPPTPTPTAAPTPESTPTPTPEPEAPDAAPEPETEPETGPESEPETPDAAPEPESDSDSESSDEASGHDANGDGTISRSEYRQALEDYIDGKITYLEMLEIVKRYLAPSG